MMLVLPEPVAPTRATVSPGATANETAAGETGEIVCRPREPHVMFEGYHDAADATAAQWRDGCKREVVVPKSMRTAEFVYPSWIKP